MIIFVPAVSRFRIGGDSETGLGEPWHRMADGV
jgi:hypothetical protein